MKRAYNYVQVNNQIVNFNNRYHTYSYTYCLSYTTKYVKCSFLHLMNFTTSIVQSYSFSNKINFIFKIYN